MERLFGNTVTCGNKIIGHTIILVHTPNELSEPTKEIHGQNVERNPWLLLAVIEPERREVGRGAKHS